MIVSIFATTVAQLFHNSTCMWFSLYLLTQRMGLNDCGHEAVNITQSCEPTHLCIQGPQKQIIFDNISQLLFLP